MLINVPQYIDVEDKVAGPLTLKQLGWMLVLGIILLILWNTTSGIVFFIFALPLGILFVAMAFFKPYGQPMISFVTNGIMFFFRPKVYVWKRAPQNVINVPQKSIKKETVIQEKHLSRESLQDLARLLDSEGNQYNEKIEDILKKPPIKKA